MTPEREAVAKIVMEWNETPGHREMSLVDRIITEHLTPLRIALATAEREAKNAKALAVARGRALKKARDMFINIRSEIEDEGDRVYFRSTNDADAFKERVDDLDSWCWDDIIAEGKIADIYEISRKAHEQLRAAEARAASLEGERDAARQAVRLGDERAEALRLKLQGETWRAIDLEGLLTEARENQAASQRMTASLERSLARSIALHEAAEGLLDEAVKALTPFARHNSSEAIVNIDVFGTDIRRARELLTRIEAREGGEDRS